MRILSFSLKGKKVLKVSNRNSNMKIKQGVIKNKKKIIKCYRTSQKKKRKRQGKQEKVFKKNLLTPGVRGSCLTSRIKSPFPLPFFPFYLSIVLRSSGQHSFPF